MSDLLSILILNGDSDTHEAFSHLPDAQIAAAEMGSGGWIEGLRSHPIDILVVQLSSNADYKPALSGVERAKAEFADLCVFVTSPGKSPDLIIAAMRAGAQEFFPKPIPEQELKAAVERCRRRKQTHGERSSGGRLVSVFSKTGGVGVTTLAVNLGVALAQSETDRAALVDLNLQHGDAASLLNLEPRYSILDACDSSDHVDSDKLQSCLTQHSSGLAMLSEPPHPAAAETVSPRQVQSVLQQLRAMFPWVLVDMPHVFDPRVLAALEVSSTILLVTVATIPSLRSTRKALLYFRELGYPADKVKLVVNRISKVDRIETREITRSLDCETFWTCPNNYMAVVDALNTGIPLVAQKRPSNVAKSILEMAAAIGRFGHNGHP
jgi:pilus assembly protein CpaE